MVGAHQNMTWLRPFAIRGLALATINLSTKFVISNSTHHKDIKGDTECRKWSGLE